MDAHRLVPDDAVPASRKLGRDDAADLATRASTVIVAKGKNVSTFEVKGVPSEETLQAMLGPTGNLRAPALRMGKTLIVGFNEDAWKKLFR